MPGLSATGFDVPTQADIIDAYDAELRSRLGNGITTEPQSVFGQLVGVLAVREALLWDLGLAIYNAFNPDAAEGEALDFLSALTGTERRARTKSTVTLRFTGTAGTSIPAGRIVANAAGVRFVTTETAVVGGGGTVDVDAESQDYGPVAAVAGTLTIIETPVSDITAVTNLDEATLGLNRENDAELRLRRNAELQRVGNGAVDAIRARVSEIVGVRSVAVHENVTAATNADGLPPHSFEVVAEDATDPDVQQQIAEAIFNAKPAGIQTYGNTTLAVTDAVGIEHSVKFTVPDDVEIYVLVNVVAQASLFGDETTAKDAIKASIAAAGDALGVTHDVWASRFIPEVFKVPGVLNVSSVYVEGVPAGDPAPTPIDESYLEIDIRERPVFSTARVTVNVTYTTP